MLEIDTKGKFTECLEKGDSIYNQNQISQQMAAVKLFQFAVKLFQFAVKLLRKATCCEMTGRQIHIEFSAGSNSERSFVLISKDWTASSVIGQIPQEISKIVFIYRNKNKNFHLLQNKNVTMELVNQIIDRMSKQQAFNSTKPRRGDWTTEESFDFQMKGGYGD